MGYCSDEVNISNDVSVGTGATDAKTLRVVEASDSPDVTVLGAVTDAAITTDTTGTIKGVLRGILKIFIDIWDGTKHLFKVGIYDGSGNQITTFGSATTAANTARSTATLVQTVQLVDAAGNPHIFPVALGANGGLKVEGIAGGVAQPVSLATAPALVAGTATIGKLITPTVSKTDSITRPANATPYAANQSINCNVVVTALVSIVGNTVTLTGPNALAVGDRITVAGVDGNFTGATNINGNWVCITGTNATTVVFVTSSTPTGTPATSTHGTVAKCMSLDLADAVGNGVILSRLSVAFSGVGMTGAVRVYVYTQQTTTLVDQSAFTLLAANDIYRRDYFDLYPVTEGSGSDVTFASIRLWEVFKCDPADTRLYFRVVAEAAGTPASAGVITLRVTAVQLGG